MSVSPIRTTISGLGALVVIAAVSVSADAARLNQGEMRDGSYVSETGEFEFAVPDGGRVFDGSHPLGGYIVVEKLPKPINVWGVAYVRAAQSENGLFEDDIRGFMKAGHGFWAQTYDAEPLKTLSEEWIEIDGQPAYFAVMTFRSSSSSRPGYAYGSLSVHRGNFTYVFFEGERATRATRPTIADPETRKANVMKVFEQMTFIATDEIKHVVAD